MRLSIGAAVLIATLFILIIGSISTEAIICGVIKGTVTDKKTGEPICSAIVQIVGTTQGQLANEKGEYIILHVAPGQHSMSFRVVGYNDVHIDSVLVTPSDTIEVSAELDAKTRCSQIVINRAVRPRADYGSPVILSRDEKMSLPIQNMNEVVAPVADTMQHDSRSAVLRPTDTGSSVRKSSRDTSSAMPICGHSGKVRRSLQGAEFNEVSYFINVIKVDTATDSSAAEPAATAPELDGLTPPIPFDCDSIKPVIAPQGFREYLKSRLEGHSDSIEEPIPRFAPNTYGSISGVVVDSGSGEPLPSVAIQIVGTTTGGLSWPDGSYLFIRNVPPGTYSLTFRLAGYRNIQLDEITVTAGATVEVNVEMSAMKLRLSMHRHRWGRDLWMRKTLDCVIFR